MPYLNKRYLDVNVRYVIGTEKAYLLITDFNDMRQWFPKFACRGVIETTKEVQRVSIMEYYLQKKVMGGVCIVCGKKTMNLQYKYCKECYEKHQQKSKKSTDKVICVFNDIGEFYDVYPKISESLQDMRNKILGIKGVKWEWHVVLTVDDESLIEIMRSGGFSGKVLKGFLRNTKTIYRIDRKFFWKYEEGSKNERPYYHLLLEFKRNFNMGYILNKLYPQGWRNGLIDVKRLINGQRRYSMNKGKSNTEMLMGLLLKKKWKNGIVYAKQIEGLGQMHQKNLIYYVNKDLLKSTGFKNRKKDSKKWNFGKGYEFETVSLFSYKESVSVNKCIHKMMTTKGKFLDYYYSFGRNGESFFFSKIRKMKKGLYFKTVV